MIDKDNGTVTADKSYTWVGDTLALERDNTLSGSPVTKKFFDQGVVQNGSPLYYVKDQQGSVRQLVDTSGKVQAQYDYDPYGNRTYTGGSTKSDIGYGGYLHHEASGLDFTLHRAYDPTRARWLNRDPIGEAGGTNLYTPVNNNPVTYTDPSGLEESPLKVGKEVVETTMDVVNGVREGLQAQSWPYPDQFIMPFSEENIAQFAYAAKSIYRFLNPKPCPTQVELDKKAARAWENGGSSLNFYVPLSSDQDGYWATREWKSGKSNFNFYVPSGP